ncbi:MAG: hypothetical protein KDD51_15355 [Bdellovibrionales bacterium]|nr:hypothetical protein [Bdellovibrionales bacterium]
MPTGFVRVGGIFFVMALLGLSLCRPSYSIAVECERALTLPMYFEYFVNSLQWMWDPKSGGVVEVNTKAFFEATYVDQLRNNGVIRHFLWETTRTFKPWEGATFAPFDIHTQFPSIGGRAVFKPLHYYSDTVSAAVYHVLGTRGLLSTPRGGDVLHSHTRTILGYEYPRTGVHIDGSPTFLTSVGCFIEPCTSYKTADGSWKTMELGNTLLFWGGAASKDLGIEWTRGVAHKSPETTLNTLRGLVQTFYGFTPDPG